MRLAVVMLLSGLLSPLCADDAPPRSLDERLTIELFAEQPQLRTPTGIDVDHHGRVWVIESNTHFRPEDYDGHPSDRLLILTDTDGDGRADDVKTFADGFQFAMSVAVRPVWLDEVRVESEELGVESKEGDTAQTAPHAAPHNPQLTQVFLAERSGLWLLEDTDGDDLCDRRTKLVTLETEGNYPHNGLAGCAFGALGWMYFGLGENLGAPYKLVSREMAQSPGVPDAFPQDSQLSTLNSPLSGGGEGGNLYRMRPNGTHLTHWATGFWNPHASCVDAFGRVFTVDNDPDSRPPCRLLHIIEGGDYGFRFRNGRKGLHPFTSWNGEIPGTLPMVAGTGEAPSGILAYEHDAFPEEYLGNLFVTSWGDHRIDRFRLKVRRDPLRPRVIGPSFESIAEPVITGGENFRPVGIALAPDGSMFVSDWVLRDYKLHGMGRVWRVRPTESKPSLDRSHEFSMMNSHSLDELKSLTSSASLPVRRAAAHELSRTSEGRNALIDLALELQAEREPSPNQRRSTQEVIWARHNPATEKPRQIPYPHLWELEKQAAWIENVDRLHATDDPFNIATTIHDLSVQNVPHWLLRHWYEIEKKTETDQTRTRLMSARTARRIHRDSVEFVQQLLQEQSPRLRRLGVQWAAEERLSDLRPQVEAALKSEPMTSDLFLATLAALEMLDGKDPKDFDQTPPGKYVFPLLQDPAASPAVKAQALRLVDPADEGLTPDLLKSLLASDDPTLRLEAIRSLGMSPSPDAVEILAATARRQLDKFAVDERPIEVQEERWALLGLAAHVQRPEAREALADMLPGPDGFRTDVFRALREVAMTDHQLLIRMARAREAGTAEARRELNGQLFLIDWLKHPNREQLDPTTTGRPRGDDDWRDNVLADEPAATEFTVAAGERIFFHPNGPRCYQCHTVNGRGGRIGPDLSRIGAAMSREKLLDSILNPSKEVSPQFTTWNLVTTAGQVHTGMIVFENKGETTIGNSDGKTVTIPTIDIETRTPQTISVMPEKLEDRLTVTELRDLLAFLESLR
ncbi:MAG: c-type cytochrome [Planctomycetaceae bacterium]|nr:c-type cytochrome [Planctomycetaceae bacterium]